MYDTSRENRRRGMTTAERDDGLRELTETSHGAFTASIIERAAVPALVAGARGGDPHAGMTAQAIIQWLAAGRDLSPGEAHECMLCGHEFLNEKPHAFACLMPFASYGPRVSVSGICKGCGTTINDLQAAALNAWRKVWPGLQPMAGGVS
jgi:hypothetical protein